MSLSCADFEALSCVPSPSQAQAAAMEAHLAECPACRARCDRRLRPESLPHLGIHHLAAALAPEDKNSRLDFSDEQIQWELDFLSLSDSPNSLRLGHYLLKRVLGRSQMSIVLLAFDELMARPAVLKFLARDRAANATDRYRFIREAKNAAAFQDSHFVEIWAVKVVRNGCVEEIQSAEHVEGRPFLEMEFIKGETLQAMLDRNGALGVREILLIGEQIATALAVAHEKGFVHRDVKPANILLQNGIPRAKIADYGLTKPVGDTALTDPGAIAGTPDYIAPEQARGEEATHLADLFSFGSVLYAMCTGQVPFRAGNPVAVLKRVCEDAPHPIRDLNPDIPVWLVEIISKLQAKKPADRYQSSSEVASLFRQHLAHFENPPALNGNPPRPSRPILVTSLVVATVVVLVAFIIYSHVSRDKNSSRLSPMGEAGKAPEASAASPNKSQASQPPSAIDVIGDSEKLTTAAWLAFAKGRDLIVLSNKSDEAKPHLEKAVRLAQACIKDYYDPPARDMQKALAQRERTERTPPVPDWTGRGTVPDDISDAQKVLIHKNWAVNDVSACLFIIGRSLEYLLEYDASQTSEDRCSKAREAYQRASELSYGRCWDLRGWFWCPPYDAGARLKQLPPK